MKNILVVGGSSGIGKAIVKKLQENDENNIIIISRTLEDFKDFNGKYLEADVTDQELNFDLGIGSLDGLVYAPGTINLRPFTGLKIDDFQKELEVNYLGAIRVLQLVLKQLRKSDKASVVFFSTVAAKVGMNFHSSIAGAKGALEAAMRALAAEYAPKIRFNCVAPSLTETPLASKLLSNEKSRKMSIERHPMKDIGTAEDVARVAIWLMSEEASFVTGQTIGVDGGLSTLR